MPTISIEQYIKEFLGLHGKITVSFPSKNPRSNDIWNLYKYGENNYKLIYFKKKSRKTSNKSTIYGTEDIEENEERLSQSISRTKSKIFELAICNNFEWFCTFTQDKEKRDRFDLSEFRKDFAQFIRDLNKKRSASEKIKYLLIPEQHKDGAWHMHGLLCGLKKSELVKNENGHLDWTAYRRRFGFFSVSKIKNKNACCKYITKYISKDLARTNIEGGNHLFFASQGLKRRECVVFEEFEKCPINTNSKWDFENDYVKIKWLEPKEKQVL
jgi:hypothetical protein